MKAVKPGYLMEAFSTAAICGVMGMSLAAAGAAALASDLRSGAPLIDAAGEVFVLGTRSGPGF